MAKPKKGVIPPQFRANVAKKKAAAKSKTKKKSTGNPFAKKKSTRSKKK